MEESFNQEIIPADPPSYDSLLGKWLRFLFPIQVAGLVLSFAAALDFVPKTVSFLSCAVMVCVTVALFSMASANKSYRTAAILRCVTVVGSLIVIFGATLLSFVVSVCSIIANYMEYQGHSQVVFPKDAKLSKQWKRLFVWQLVVGILTGLFTMAGTVIAIIAGAATETIVSIVLFITVAISACVQIFYLLYLKRMQAYFPQ